MKMYRVSNDLKKYVRRVLLRSYYKCKFSTDKDGQIWCFTNASSDVFHMIVQRAKCEKKTKETGIFQVTAKEADNAVMLTALLQQNQASTYQVIDDNEGIRRENCI